MVMETEEQIIKKRYELGFILKDEDLTPVKTALDKYNPEELLESSLVKVNLSYPIKKQTQAFFGYFIFNLEPEKIAQLSSDLKNIPSLLRYLLIKIPSFISKEERKTKKTPTLERPLSRKQQSKAKVSILTNEALEKLKEEILQ